MDDAIKCRMAWEPLSWPEVGMGYRVRILDPCESVGLSWHAIEGVYLGQTTREAESALAQWNADRLAARFRPIAIVAGPPGRPQVKPGTAVRWHDGRWEWRHPKLGWTRAD